MKIISPLMNFIWIMMFDFWNFKNTSFGLYKQFDYYSTKVYWNNNLLHKNE
jgi:hypothetical protein